MVAMATAEYWRLTGDAQAEQKTRDVVAQLAPYQNPDGSFPHWCLGSRDIHYTALDGDGADPHRTHRGRSEHRSVPLQHVHVSRGANRPQWPGDLRRNRARASQIACSTTTVARPAAVTTSTVAGGRWSPLTADCSSIARVAQVPTRDDISDLARGWGHHPGSLRLLASAHRPEYPWTTADTSVVCMSINLWALSTAVADRVGRGVPVDLVLDDIDTTSVITPDHQRSTRRNPSRCSPTPLSAAASCNLPGRSCAGLAHAVRREWAQDMNSSPESLRAASMRHAGTGAMTLGAPLPRASTSRSSEWAPRFRHGGSRSCTDTLENGPSLGLTECSAFSGQGSSVRGRSDQRWHRGDPAI